MVFGNDWNKVPNDPDMRALHENLQKAEGRQVATRGLGKYMKVGTAITITVFCTYHYIKRYKYCEESTMLQGFGIKSTRGRQNEQEPTMLLHSLKVKREERSEHLAGLSVLPPAPQSMHHEDMMAVYQGYQAAVQDQTLHDAITDETQWKRSTRLH